MHRRHRPYVPSAVCMFAGLCAMAVATAASAQPPDAMLRGTVVDPDGHPVVAALVVVEGPAAAPRSARSDAKGAFEFGSLPPGHYSIRASTPGLASPAIDADLAQSASIRIDVRLRIVAVDEQLVVTATQVDQPLSRLPDSATVITGAEIDTRQQFALGDALRVAPGLTVQQSGGPGSVTSVFTRGGESDYTLVLVDGVRANAFGGGMDLSQVPLADVDRIEVIRGPQSALYGADAIGGVVHVLTRSGGSPSAEGLVEGGSRAMRRVAGSTTGEVGQVRWQAGGNYWAEDGYTGLASNGEPVTNDDGRMSQGAAMVGWRGAASGADVQGTVRYVDTDRGTPGPYGSDPAGRFFGVDDSSRTKTTRASVGLRWVQPWFGATSRVRQRTEVDTADYDVLFASAFPSEGESRRSHVRTQTDATASASLGFTGGVEWLGERGGSTYITAGQGDAVPVERDVWGLFGEARWTPAARLSVTAGVRGERIHRGPFPGDPLAFQPRPDFAAETLTSVNPKLAVSWMLAGDSTTARAWTRVHGAAGTGIRPPDAFEIAFTDNAGLKPERNTSLDVGVAQALAGGAVLIDATVFSNNYDDLIVAVGSSFAGVSRWRTDNISNARARGLELSAAWRPAGSVSLHAAYTYLSTEILAVDGAASAPPPYSVGDPLLRRPRHQGSFDATWTRDRLAAFLQMQLRGETLDADPAWGPSGGLFVNPGYGVTNLGASVRVARGVTLQGRVLNLFDRAYEEVLGYPAPRRAAYVGARVAAGR